MICAFNNRTLVMTNPLIDPWLHCVFKCIYISTEDIL